MSTEESMMTTQDAVTLLRDVLCISSPVDKLKSNREAFLQELIMAWFHYIPFQSSKAIYTPQEDRHKPTFPEIKQDIFSKLGGLCYDHNVCCYEVLRVLGYDVYLATCEVSFADSHALVIVQNLTREGSIHMVDVGAGYPTFRAVPLDFELESPEFYDSYLRYKFVRKGDIIIRQHHADTDPRAGLWPDRVEDGWYSFIYVDFSHPRKISHFHKVMTKIYTTPLPTPPYLTSPRCMTWPNGRFVCIKDTTLLVESEGGHVQKSYFHSLDEILDAYDRYFPQFSKENIRAALTNENVNLDFGKKK